MKFQLFFLCCLSTLNLDAEPVSVGAIRWDAWTGGRNFVGRQVEDTLSASKYHNRLPFYAKIHGSTSVSIDATKQDIMDREIQFASDAGIKYWAFLWYSEKSGLAESRNLYHKSRYNKKIDFCLIIESSRFVHEVSINDLIQEMKSPTYFSVMDGRPLFYLLGHKDLSPEHVQTFREKCQRAGLKNPYLVLLRQDGDLEARNKFELDAFGLYAVSWLKDGVSYQHLAKTDRQQWDWVGLRNEHPIVPQITAGWDKRPRHESPVSWESNTPENSWVQMPSPAELVDHVKDAINWVNKNPAVAESNTVLIYAWNEHDEGGWLCPNLPEYGYDKRLRALKKVMKPLEKTPEPRP